MNTIKTFLNNFQNGKYDANDKKTQCAAGWDDWFCHPSKLQAKTKKLVQHLKSIVKSKKINIDTMYVIFRNNCPVHGRLYDDFRICDINTENVVYTIIPSSGHDSIKGKAQVWGCENDYNEPLVNGTWKDVQKFFGVEITTMKKKSSKKPKVQLIGKDSNIFNLLGIASKALRENQMQEQADDMISRVKQSQSFDEALSIITEYVEAY